jgi:hypothetical protein
VCESRWVSVVRSILRSTGRVTSFQEHALFRDVCRVEQRAREHQLSVNRDGLAHEQARIRQAVDDAESPTISSASSLDKRPAGKTLSKVRSEPNKCIWLRFCGAS